MAFGPLVDASWLRDHIHDPDVRVVDFRWYLLGRRGRDEYMRGHIPGAVFVDLEAVTGEQGGGRHPLPAPGQFEAEMQKAGVGVASRVVVYDDATVAPTATRLWFLLGLFGHRAQAVLDGGLQAWAGPLETETPDVRRGDFRAQPPDMSRVLDHEAVGQVRDVPLIDARTGERFRGEKEPIDPKAGHIPGALNLPYTQNLTPEGKFKSPHELRHQFASVGA
ncbi:MAG TPA: rhodanese-like domain-containing protein, partial [Candidatus Dormibacteraeota bacterium]|nr:rhodanese-like domain-containing protein [Candidatus Dormibacteraeota bacterium]